MAPKTTTTTAAAAIIAIPEMPEMSPPPPPPPVIPLSPQQQLALKQALGPLAFDRLKRTPAMYPLRGMAYLITHPQLWLGVLCRLLLIALFAIAITVVMFVFAMPAQETALAALFDRWRAGSSGDGAWVPWVAWILAIIFTILEAATALVLFVMLFFPISLDNLFNDVLRLEGQGAVVKPVFHHTCLRSWHRITAAETIRVLDAMLMVITVPLNAIPILGTIIYLAVNGYFTGSSYHLSYLAMRGYRFRDMMRFVAARRASYTSFGMVAVTLESIPFFNCLFIFTNVIGAALWAADMERQAAAENVAHHSMISVSVIDQAAVTATDVAVDAVGRHGTAVSDAIVGHQAGKSRLEIAHGIIDHVASNLPSSAPEDSSSSSAPSSAAVTDPQQKVTKKYDAQKMGWLLASK